MSSEQRIEKQDTAAFFTGSALLSRPCIFSCLPHSSPLPFSLPLSLCLLSLSVCLSFALNSCRIHTVQCVLFLNEAFFSCSQPVSFAEARPQLADCGCMVAMLTEKAPSWHLREERGGEREGGSGGGRNREKEMRQKNIQWHRRVYYSYRCALALKQRPDSDWLSLLFPYFALKTCTLGYEILLSPHYDHKAWNRESYSIFLNELLQPRSSKTF